jgi:hypothetical protein
MYPEREKRKLQVFSIQNMELRFFLLKMTPRRLRNSLLINSLIRLKLRIIRPIGIISERVKIQRIKRNENFQKMYKQIQELIRLIQMPSLFSIEILPLFVSTRLRRKKLFKLIFKRN